MRLRRRFLFKLAVLVVASLFVIPLLLHYLDDSQREELEKGFLRLRNRIRESRFVSPAAALTHGAENVMRNPLLPIQNSSSGLKVYGPRTFFKEGQIGNYELVEKAASIFGPGEMGEPVYTSMNEKQAADQSIQEYGFNMVASDKVSLDRVVPDTRMEECKFWHYPKKLPTTSVIIVFHNEGWSTLLRTVHSVINMSPPSLLHEIVMVDDMSDKENLKEKLEKYILRFNGKVKLYRNKERGGLIRTRTRGAKYATGDVIVFLDAHCECNRNWLPPLLARIAYDRTIMAVPIVESVDWNNFRYRPVYTTNHHRGIFEWGFLYKESQVPQKELKRRLHHSEPYWSPTHAGGLFAMDRKYFFELGGYDPGLQIWGGENFELSFKIWQCGGSIEWVPCSRVGHIYRNHMPYGFGNISFKIPIILLNYMRVVEVWLDDKFKEYFYTREPSIRGYPVGNITEQLEFKKSHKCKSFQWFMDNIAYEVFDRFPPLPPNSAWGEIKLLNTQKCWDSHGQPVGGGPIGISVCHHLGGNQLFRLNNKGQLAMGERCIEAVSGDTLSLQFCETEPTGPWDWDKDIGLIVNKDYNRCVEPGNDNKLHLKACDIKSESQQWEINEASLWAVQQIHCHKTQLCMSICSPGTDFRKDSRVTVGTGYVYHVLVYSLSKGQAY